MQCTSFVPGCYSIRDLNVGANGGSWPLYNNERNLKSGHSHNVFLPLPTIDQFLVYDKEVLRQTMLKHESIFRDQVQELHRLYRRQRELMDEIKRRELSKQNIKLQTSQFNSFLPKVSSESAQKMWQVSCLPWVNPVASRSSVSSAENFQSTSIFSLWESTQAGLDTTPTDDNLKGCKLSCSKCEKPKKKMLDLELSADEYIDSEDEDQFGEEKVSKVPELPCYPPKRMPKVSQQSDLKLFPCGGVLLNSICQGGGSNPDTVSRRTNDLADLNEPIWLEDDFLSSETYHKGIPCQNQELPGKSTSDLQDFSKEIVRAVEACLKSKHPDEDRQQELLPRYVEAGQSISNLNPLPQVSSSVKLPRPYKQLKVEPPAEFSAFNLLDECERKLQNQRTNSVRETSEQNHDLCNDDYWQLASSCLPISYQLVPHSDLANIEPSSVSSQRKPTCIVRQNPIAVQALPCFNIAAPSRKSTKSSVASSPLSGNRSHCSINLRSSLGVECLRPLGNSFCVGSRSESRTEACSPLIKSNHLNCSTANASPSEVHRNYFHYSSGKDVNSAKAMDLNMPPNCLLDSEVSQQNVGTEDSQALLPGPSEKPDYSNKHNESREDLSQTDLVVSQDFAKSVCDAEPKRFTTSDSPGNEKILGSSIVEKPRVFTDEFLDPASSSNSHLDASEDNDIKNNQKAGLHDINLASCPVLNSGKQCTTDDVSEDIMVDSKLSGVGNHIDLNSCINEDESSPAVSIPRVIIKTVAEIDLGAPVSPENKECSPPRGESEENQLETPIKLSKQEDGDEKDELVRMAAEAIVWISTRRFQKLFSESTVCETLEPSLGDSLHWFARVVSSVAVDLENEAGVVLSGKDGSDQQELSSDGNDYFEAMTLELNETKLCKRNGQKQEETGAVLSQSQPSRGRMTRRGRQQQDFQTEVLPSLASLSRHEVTEDLHTIGGLTEAAGFPVETSPGRRNACSRARRQSGNSSCHGMEKTVWSPLKSWGKINRRRRGPRSPACNPQLIFS